MTQQNSPVVEHLKKAYMMEMETVANYLANSVHLDGVQAEEIKRSLGSDVQEELGHATKLAHRIKQLGGDIPGSLDLARDQQLMQPPADSTNVECIVKGVIDAESAAIEHYQMIIEETDGKDHVTQDLAIELKADEEEHRRQFEGFRAGFRRSDTVPA